MKIAIVHDDLVQWGGAERVLEAISEIYPDASIYTSIFDQSNKTLTKRFGNKKIHTSFLQKIPGWKRLYKPLLPLYPIAFEQFDFTDYDLVISHTTRFAKSIITKPKTIHVCYCHTPPRFLWQFSGERIPILLKPFLDYFRKYDAISSKRVDYFLAGSKNAKDRIKDIYEVESKVIYPFVDFKRVENVEGFDGGYFVVIARLNKYKRVDLAVEACLKLGISLKIIGTGTELGSLRVQSQESRVQNNIEFLGNLTDEMVVKVLAGARALIVPGIEDFGITPLEAQALGKPVIAYRAGGVLETVIDGETGVFFDQQNVKSLYDAIEKFRDLKIDSEKCRVNAKRFSKVKFMENFKKVVDGFSSEAEKF